MKLKNVYLITTRDEFEFPVASFSDIKDLSDYTGYHVSSLQSLISRGSSIDLRGKRYSLKKVILDIVSEDDSFPGANYAVSADYRCGEFYQEYKTIEEATACAFALINKKCFNVRVVGLHTNLLHFSFMDCDA